VEIQIHAHSKGNVAVDDVALLANRCTKCHGNAVSRFHLIAHYVSGVNLSLLMTQPAYFGINCDP